MKPLANSPIPPSTEVVVKNEPVEELDVSSDESNEKHSSNDAIQRRAADSEETSPDRKSRKQETPSDNEAAEGNSAISPKPVRLPSSPERSSIEKNEKVPLAFRGPFGQEQLSPPLAFGKFASASFFSLTIATTT